MPPKKKKTTKPDTSRAARPVVDKPINVYRKIAFTFVGIAVVLLVVIFYYTFSNVKISVKSMEEETTIDFIIRIKEGGPTTGSQLAGHILDVTKTAQAEFESSFSLTGEPAQATGMVRLMNDSDIDQPLVATTRLLSPDDVLFRIRESVVVPANGSIEAEAYADQPGVQGEIEPTRFTIPGLNTSRQLEVYAISDQKMTGGTKAAYQVTAEDLDKAQIQMIDELTIQASNEFKSTIPADVQILEDKILTQVTKREADAEIGDSSEKFSLDLEVRIITAAANRTQLTNLVGDLFRNNIPADKTLVGLDAGDISYEIQNYDPVEKAVHVKASISGQVSLRSTSPIFDKDKLIGLSGPEVKSYLENFTSVLGVEVDFSPFWVRTVPNMKDHIEIEIIE
ncbi:MAG TPA: hypothetical protein VGA49_00145 [Patescibacteria group bacterium]